MIPTINFVARFGSFVRHVESRVVDYGHHFAIVLRLGLLISQQLLSQIFGHSIDWLIHQCLLTWTLVIIRIVRDTIFVVCLCLAEDTDCGVTIASNGLQFYTSNHWNIQLLIPSCAFNQWPDIHPSLLPQTLNMKGVINKQPNVSLSPIHDQQ